MEKEIEKIYKLKKPILHGFKKEDLHAVIILEKHSFALYKKNGGRIMVGSLSDYDFDEYFEFSPEETNKFN